jgi:hypothetical protein
LKHHALNDIRSQLYLRAVRVYLKLAPSQKTL